MDMGIFKAVGKGALGCLTMLALYGGAIAWAIDGRYTNWGVFAVLIYVSHKSNQISEEIADLRSRLAEIKSDTQVAAARWDSSEL